MNLPLIPIRNLFNRFLGGPPGVRIEDRRWRRSIDALHRDVEGLRRRMGGSSWPALRR
ncbi:hypothetical protein [Syntrophotalea acetylenivorans]|uniref:hypothetical protein n=1 Tax=Syntrophotalea acetylenivorans TaxID=1842532 RepID=UPI000B30F091|nr:hypothetical protein [Syntrophotalea acetylenivorans]